MGAINLSKGATLDLEKRLSRVKVGLAWEASTYGGAPFDADVSAAVLSGDGDAKKFVANEWFVFYNNKSSPGGAIEHSGDNRTGSGQGDDETITINLAGLPSETSEVSILMTIHDGETRQQDWSKLKAVATLYDADANTILARYDLGTDFAGKVSVQPVSFYKNSSGNWTYKALGAGYNFGLAPFVEKWQR